MPDVVWLSRLPQLMREKSAREKRDIMWKELADFCQVDPQQVVLWKRERKTVSAVHTEKICRFFACEPWDLWELKVPEEETALA